MRSSRNSSSSSAASLFSRTAIIMRRRALKKVFPLLRILSKLDEEDRRILLQYLTHDGCEGVYECVHNVLYNPNIPAEDRKQMHFQLNDHKEQLRFLASKKQKAEEKKKVLLRANKPLGPIFNYVMPMLQNDFNKMSM